MPVEILQVVAVFSAMAGCEAFSQGCVVERIVGLLHAVQLQVDVFFGVGCFNRCEHVAALTYKSHSLQSSETAVGEKLGGCEYARGV